MGIIQEGGVFMRLHNISGGRAVVMVFAGIEMIGLVYCGWSYTWTTVASKITAECNRLVAYLATAWMVCDDIANQHTVVDYSD